VVLLIFRIIFFTVLIVLCSWFAFWPTYEWIVGIRPWFTFLNQNQMILFGLGLIGFIASVVSSKKVMLG
jgi:hypothetical protein